MCVLAMSAPATRALADDAPADDGETIVIVDAPAPVEDAAASSTVITARRTPRSAESMPDLLGDVPGVTVSRMGGVGAPALLSLRGSSWEQVRVYLDGVDLDMAAGGGVDLSSLPVGDVERVEVYRGVTPIAFGGSAIGGVLSVETRRPRATGATLEMGGGSFGTWLGGGSIAHAGDGYGVYAGLHALRSAGDFRFVDDRGTSFDPTDDEVVARRNNAVREVDGVVRGELDVARGTLSLIALGFDREQGLPGYPRYATMRSSLRTRRAVLSAAYQRPVGVAELRTQVYGYGLEQRFSDPAGEISPGPRAARDRTLAVGATARARWRFDAIEPAALLDARVESFSPVDLRTNEHGVESTRQSATLGGEAAYRVAGFTLAPSLRLELSRDRAAGRDNNGALSERDDAVTRAMPVARFAATRAIFEGFTARGNVARYARLPTFLELYGNNGMILGNRALEPEHGITADLGAAYALRRDEVVLRVDGAGFAAFTDELIQFQQNAYGVARARNIAAARILGFESSADLAYRAAHLYAQATFTDARDRSESVVAADHQLPYRPRIHLSIRPELRDYRVGPVALGTYVEVDVTSGNYIDPANLVEIPQRTMLGAGASVGFDRGRVRVIASVNNLTNSAVTDVLSYPLPGRAFYLTVALATQAKDAE